MYSVDELVESIRSAVNIFFQVIEGNEASISVS